MKEYRSPRDAPMFAIAAGILVMAGLFFWSCFGAKRTGIAIG